MISGPRDGIRAADHWAAHDRPADCPIHPPARPGETGPCWQGESGWRRCRAESVTAAPERRNQNRRPDYIKYENPRWQMPARITRAQETAACTFRVFLSYGYRTFAFAV